VYGSALCIKWLTRHADAARDRANTARWRDRTFRVTARAIPRLCWLTASIDVHLDDVALINSGGVLRLKGGNVSRFDNRSETHSVRLDWVSPGRGIDFPFQLSIDDQILIDSKVRPQNWPVMLIAVIVLVPILILTLVAIGDFLVHLRKLI
jgi:hypothetical protein